MRCNCSQKSALTQGFHLIGSCSTANGDEIAQKRCVRQYRKRDDVIESVWKIAKLGISFTSSSSRLGHGIVYIFDPHLESDCNSFSTLSTWTLLSSPRAWSLSRSGPCSHQISRIAASSDIDTSLSKRHIRCEHVLLSVPLLLPMHTWRTPLLQVLRASRSPDQGSGSGQGGSVRRGVRRRRGSDERQQQQSSSRQFGV